jgi:hypothetical protein
MTPSTTTIPITVTPEAADRIAELGFHQQVVQMVDHARRLPDVIRIEVVLNERYDLGGEPGVAVMACSTRVFDPNDTTQWDLARWAVTTFQPEVLEHLLVTFVGGTPNEG